MVFTIFSLESLTVITILQYFTSVIYLTSYFFAWKESLSPIWGAVHTYADIFLKRKFSPPFSKQKRVHTYCIWSAFARPYKNAKQWKDDSIPHRAWVMLVVNDVLHHRVRNIRSPVRPPVNEWPAFSKSPLWLEIRASLKRCVLADRFHQIRVDG